MNLVPQIISPPEALKSEFLKSVTMMQTMSPTRYLETFEENPQMLPKFHSEASKDLQDIIDFYSLSFSHYAPGRPRAHGSSIEFPSDSAPTPFGAPNATFGYYSSNSSCRRLVCRAWLAARFALSRFYREKVWERKTAAYTAIFDALHDMDQWFAEHLATFSNDRDLTTDTQIGSLSATAQNPAAKADLTPNAGPPPENPEACETNETDSWWSRAVP